MVTIRRRQPRLSRLPQGLRDDRGSTSLEMVLIFPALLLAFFIIIQGAMYFHARNVALAAAREGLRVAASENGTAPGGAASAEAFVTQAGGDKVIQGVSVVPVRGQTQASVTVLGTSVSLIPGIGGFSVSQTASGTVERTTTVGQP